MNPELDAAVGWYEAGLSVQQVATLFGVSRQSMWETLKRRGVSFRSNLRYGEENHFYRGGSLGDRRAQNLVYKAEKRGLLVRPQECEECGESDQEKGNGQSYLDAHHDDYSKPLEVRWLCQRCHFNWHRENQPLAAASQE